MNKYIRMPSSLVTTKRLWMAAILIMPLMIFWGQILGNRTISFNPLSDASTSAALPLLDPAAGSFQDEPWLHYIGSHWKIGEFPLINQDNGLGDPLLTNFQSGALYPLNIVLVLLPLSSSRFFDIFALLHIVLLVWGTALLAKRYTSNGLVAILVAGALGTSLAVTYNINMVHFRVFTWTPWLALIVIDLLRGRAAPLRIILLAVFMWCMLSAGNPQEALMDLLAVAVLAVAEMLRTPCPVKRTLRVIASLTSATLLCAPLVLIYLENIRNGNLFSVSNPIRSESSITWPWMLDFIVPRGGGFAGNWFRVKAQADMQYAIPVIWLCGLASFGRSLVRCEFSLRSTMWSLALLLAIMTGLAKIVGFGPWSWLQHIPLLNGLRFTKYSVYLVFIMLPLVVIGLNHLIDDGGLTKYRDKMSRAAFVSIAVVALFLVAILALLLDKTWIPSRNSPGFLWFTLGVISSLILAVVLPWIFISRRRMPLLLVTLCIFSLVTRGDEWPTRKPYPNTNVRTLPEIQPADLSDGNWDHGVHRNLAGFFVTDPSQLTLIEPGDKLIDPEHNIRTVLRISGDQVWLDGPRLDPKKDGYPDVYHVDPKVAIRQALASPDPSHYPRVAELLTPNSNLIQGLTSPWVFDPIMNSRYRKWMNRSFDMVNSTFWMQPKPDHPLSEKQTDLLWFLGVGLIRGYAIESTPLYRSIGDQLYVSTGAVFPECIVEPEQAVPALETLFSSGKYADLGKKSLSLGHPCKITRLGPNELQIGSDAVSKDSRVVISRIYDPGWRGANVKSFAGTLLSFQTEGTKIHQTLRYRPIGWAGSWLISLIGGLSLAILAFGSTLYRLLHTAWASRRARLL